MKRYWILALLIPFTALSISMYYVTAAEDVKPDYYLKTLGGEEKEALPMTVQARYENERVDIQTNGSSYPSEQQSYMKRLDSSFYYLEELGGLLEEHRSFLRGKRNVNAFFEDEKGIAYVGFETEFDLDKIQSDLLDISFYQKGTKKSESFQVKVQKNKDEYVSILDVQVKERTMKLMISQYQQSGKYSTPNNSEYYMYTLDLDKKSIVEKKLVAAVTTQDKSIRTIITNIWSSGLIKPSNYAIFDRTSYQLNGTKEDTAEAKNQVIVNRDILVYDIWNGQMTTIQSDPVHDMLMKGNPENLSIRYIGDDLFLTLLSEFSESRVLQYQLVENKLKHDVKLTLQDWQTEWGRAHNTQIANNRLYMLALGRKDPGVVIADLDTGKIVYQGVIERKDELGSNRLSFENISVR
ncbi:hypothetical protein [Paenibacillus sp. Soil724D2]|uniref:hypothetical protein n=1 Tax=Paenibacillus sp. (strain Soil724D2) TaxID=1736392 RepID=UPI0007124022|nr:hypothetical protein [Paenibacillus sp. Soil724D2]KRE45625.1 hypothetical protein ASG85_06240 [Paenibacillus sp. Soil724D2]